MGACLLETAFSMDTSSIKFGPGVTGEVGWEMKRLGCRCVMVVTDPRVARCEPVAITLDGHAIEGILEMMTDDVVLEASFGRDPWGTRVSGKPAVRAFLEDMFDRIPGVRWDEIRHFAHPDLVTVEWLTTDTPRGGASYKVEGCDILTIRCGKIAAKRSYRKGVV